MNIGLGREVGGVVAVGVYQQAILGGASVSQCDYDCGKSGCAENHGALEQKVFPFVASNGAPVVADATGNAIYCRTLYFCLCSPFYECVVAPVGTVVYFRIGETEGEEAKSVARSTRLS